MLSSNSLRTLASLILIAGLCSCAKDRPQRSVIDIYNPSVPKILRHEDEVTLREWNNQSSRNLSALDLIDVSGSKSQYLSIKTLCTIGDTSYSFSIERMPSSKIKVYQILPLAVLTADMNTTPASCNFELRLVNERGSSHIFPIQQTTIDPIPMDSVEFYDISESKWVAEGNSIEELDAKDLRRYEIRSSFHSDEMISLYCEAGHIETLPVLVNRDLGKFNWSLHNKDSSSDLVTKIYKSPIQLCRLLIESNGSRLGMSPLFQLNFSNKPPIVQMQQQVQDTSDNNCRNTFAELTRRKDTPIVSWTLANETPYTKYIMFSKKMFPVRIRHILKVYVGSKKINFSDPDYLYSGHYGNYNLTRLELRSGGSVTASDTNSIIEMAPNSSVVLELKFRGRLYTPSGATSGNVAALDITMNSEYQVDETDVNGKKLNNLILTPQKQHIFVCSKANLPSSPNDLTGNDYAWFDR